MGPQMATRRNGRTSRKNRLLEQLVHDAEIKWGEGAVPPLKPILERTAKALAIVERNVPEGDITPAFYWDEGSMS